MGKHVGYSITDHHSGGKLARVRKGAGYQARVFPNFEAAEKWCLDEKARLQLNLVQIGALPFGLHLAKYLAEKTRLGFNPQHIRATKRMLLDAASIITDLAAPGAKDQAREWLAKVAARDVSPRTVNHNLKILRAYAKWLMAEDKLTIDPFLSVKGVRQPKVVKPIFTVEECRRLLSQTEHAYHPRLVLQLYFGMRASDVSSWEERGGVIIIRMGKGKKDRIVPRHVAAEAIELGWVRPMPAINHTNNRKGLHRICEAAGVTIDGHSPHSLRHTWCALLCGTGENISVVREWAAHESITTTDGYARLATAYPEARTWPKGELRFLTGWCSPLPYRTTEKRKPSSAPHTAHELVEQ